MPPSGAADARPVRIGRQRHRAAALGLHVGGHGQVRDRPAGDLGMTDAIGQLPR